MRIEIEMTATAAQFERSIGPSRVAASAVHLLVLPLEGEATHRVVVEALVMEAALLVAALTRGSAKLPTMLIFMTARAVGTLRLPTVPAMAALTGRAPMCPPEWPPCDLMVKTSEIPETTRSVTVLTTERTKNTWWVRILMAADTPLNLDWAEALR